MLHSLLFSNTLTYISRFLSILDKMLPIYKNIKPAVSNIPVFIDKLSSISSQVRNRINDVNKEQVKETNLPTFFK